MSAGTSPASALEASEQLRAALHEAWQTGTLSSSPLAIILVAFDRAETAEDVQILERALHVHCARHHDVVLRRTHNEFVALLPETPPAGARHVARQIVEAMRGGQTQRVSVGLAIAVPDEHHTAEELLRRAESALASARHSGGDRCIGGATPGGGPARPTTSWLALIRDLLPRQPEPPDRQRRTDAAS